MIPGQAPTRRALVCAPLPPEYDREGGSRRIWHFIEFLLEDGWDVTFVCENEASGGRYLQLLRRRGVAVYPSFDGDAADAIEAGRFEIAIFAFWYLAQAYAPLVRRLSPETRIAVETIDLHWLREGRRVFGSGGPSGPPGRLDEDFGRDFIGELNEYAAADGVFTVSSKEARLIADIVGDPGLTHVVPDCETITASPLPLEERQGIVFIGNFRHPPNADAAEFLCEDILPRLPKRLRLGHPLYVVGNALDERIARLDPGDGSVRMVGWVPSVLPYLQKARVSVVPVRFGAGTKRKLIQALMSETPSVSTTIGVEGIDVTPGEDLLVADDAEKFAECITRLAEDDDLWRRMADAGRARVLEIHGRDVARAHFRGALRAVLGREPRRADGKAPEGAAERRRRELEAVAGAAATLPAGAPVLVVSRGDPELVRSVGSEAEHFPRAADGGYAGFHPKDSADAVRRLEELRDRFDYLLLPGTAFWWLDHYTGFRRHLDKRYGRTWTDDDCVVYRLSRGSGSGSPVEEDV